tara:strand:- start:539 stop:907 length:369 start_codon:yes stop_codon:yes gene_type:complete
MPPSHRHRGRGKKNNTNRVPIPSTPREKECCICLEEQNDLTGQLITCGNHHGVCDDCIKKLIRPCIPSLRGKCDCCGIQWKCPICREVYGFPNGWTILSMFLTVDEQNKAVYDAENEDGRLF